MRAEVAWLIGLAFMFLVFAPIFGFVGSKIYIKMRRSLNYKNKDLE